MEDFDSSRKPDAKDGEKRRKLRYGEDFLSSWLQRRFLDKIQHRDTASEEEEDEHEDDTSKEKKRRPKRFHKLAEAVGELLFKKAPPISPETPGQSRAIDKPPEAAPEFETDGSSAPYSHSEMPGAGVQQEYASPHSPAKSSRVGLEQNNIAPPSNPDRIPAVSIRNPEYHHQPEPALMFDRSQLAEAPQTPEHREVHTVEVRSSKAAAAAFLGAEILSRRRDRKLKQEVRSLKDATKKIEQKQKDIASDYLRFNQKTMPESPVALPIPELSSIQPELRTNEATKPPERRVTLPATPEKTYVAPAQSGERLGRDDIDKLVHQPEKVAPETVLHKVEVAAETNVPIEKLYERRHEVKDVPESVTATGTSSTQGGGLGLGGLPVPVIAQPQRQTSSVASHTAKPAKPQKQPPSAYREAAIGGLWGGTIVLVLLLVVLLYSYLD